MPSKKRISREKNLKELLDKTTYSVFEKDPALEHSILTCPSGAFQKPKAERPKLPNFGFFDTELKALERIQGVNDYMEELLAINSWAEESQKYKGRMLTISFNGYKASAKASELFDEMKHRHGRETAVMVFGRMDKLCEAITDRGSQRVAYSNFWNLSSRGLSSMETGYGDGLQMTEPAPNIDLDELYGSGSSSDCELNSIVILWTATALLVEAQGYRLEPIRLKRSSNDQADDVT
ncbi:hypothetical protein M407DRAFT_11645 [Tulasnella calospora MUT 4182]|uniref:Uncharacterized protein n=1 Tax=Tulasnella calospora MUT 4182 TaxID=1051891 RepID=A0A0C3Q5L3_9AGAM|nr:hypothetical protein M407DRAFT_11645 [Tulasnella calospora MUT 4182]